MDFAGRIVHVAEDDRLSRARLLASGLNVAIDHRLATLPRRDLAFFDALDTHRALLHDAASPHGDVRVEYQTLKRVFPFVLEPVEAAHFVRTVVRTVSSADAPVIGLFVEPFIAVDGRQHWAHRFARRMVAVVAHHRLMRDAEIVVVARVVSIDPNPVHLTRPAHFVLSDDRHIILRLASDQAGRTACAFIEIDDHAPGVAGLWMILGPELLIAVGVDMRGARVRVLGEL